MLVHEGHYTITNIIHDEDVDHGPCVGYYINELEMTIWFYREDETRISFHDNKDEEYGYF